MSAGSGRDARGPGADALGPASLLSFTLSALSPAVSVFITGAGVLRIAGTGAGIAMILGALLAILAAVQYAEVADALPHAGGVYAGVNRLLGGWASFIVLVLSLLASPAFLAFSGLGLADYLGVLVPGLPRLPVAAAAIVLAAGFALLRLRHSTRIAGLFLATELLAVVALAGVAAFHPARGLAETISQPMVLSPGGGLIRTPIWQMVLGTIAGAWACSGAIWGSYLGEDVHRRGSSFGATLALTGVIGAASVCIPILAVALSMTDPAALLASEAPLAGFIAQRAGSLAARGVSFVVIIAIFNNLMTMTTGLARLWFATGRDALWPAPLSTFLARPRGRSGTPLNATLLLVLVSLPALLLSERFLIVMLSAELISPLMIAFSVLLGRSKLQAGSSYRSPLYPFLSLLGIASVGLFATADWLDPSAGRPSLILLAGVLMLASLYYRLRKVRLAIPHG